MVYPRVCVRTLIFVNNFLAIVQNSCLLFADDFKIFSFVKNNDDVRMLHNDRSDLAFWTDSWQVPSNVSKCRVLHLEKKS